MHVVDSRFHPQAIATPSHSIKRAQKLSMGTKKRSDPMPLRYLFASKSINSLSISSSLIDVLSLNC